MRLLTLLVLLVGVSVGSQTVLAQSVSERIASAKAAFDLVLRQTPDKDVRAVAFFANDMSLEEVRGALLKMPNVTLKGFRHGTVSYAGGYGLRQGETVDQAIVSYKRDHLFFLMKRIEMEGRVPARIANINLKQAIDSHLKEARQMKVDFDANGLRIVGIDIYGKARHIKEFTDATPFVRVIELTEGGKPQPAILPRQ